MQKTDQTPDEQNTVCIDLIDKVFDLAVDGKVNSIAMIIIDEPGKYRVVAAGPDIDGMCAGAKQLHTQLQGLVDKANASSIIKAP